MCSSSAVSELLLVSFSVSCVSSSSACSAPFTEDSWFSSGAACDASSGKNNQTVNVHLMNTPGSL